MQKLRFSDNCPRGNLPPTETVTLTAGNFLGAIMGQLSRDQKLHKDMKSFRKQYQRTTQKQSLSDSKETSMTKELVRPS